MALDAETVIDRRRLRRRLTAWRIGAVALGLLALGLFLLGDRDVTSSSSLLPHVARVTVSGIITDDRKMNELIDRVAKADHVKAVILDINSPGGTTTGGEALYDAVQRLAAKKPVVAVCGTLATSAAYIVALATDRIFVYGNTITGSVGVLMQWPEFSELLGKLGVKYNEVKSGPLKASPSPFQPMDEPSRMVTEDMIQDGFKWFLSLVESRRGIDPKSVPGLVEGRVFSGRQAVELKLVDEIGGESEAVRWLEEKRNVAKDLKVVDWKPKSEASGWLGLGFSGFAEKIGIGAVAALIGREGTFGGGGGLGLDGLVSVWQPQKTQ